MVTKFKIELDPDVRKLMEEFPIIFNGGKSSYKPKRQLMATDVIRELKKLIEANGDKPVFVSTGFEYADARKISTYDNGDIYIGW